MSGSRGATGVEEDRRLHKEPFRYDLMKHSNSRREMKTIFPFL